MGYTSTNETPFWFRADEHAETPISDVMGIYTVSVSLMRDGHACTAFGWVDMGNRRAISQKLECYTGVPATRRSALQALQQAVSVALLDEEAGVD